MNYQQYYTNQVGGGQSIYTGRRYQRGHGLGNVLGSLFRTVAPMLRKTAVSLGKNVLRSGVSAGLRALTDIVAGAPVKTDQTTLCWGRSTTGEQKIETQ